MVLRINAPVIRRQSQMHIANLFLTAQASEDAKRDNLL